MKKNFFVCLSALLFCFSAYASNILPKEEKSDQASKIKQQNSLFPGRQCCTQSAMDEDGNIVSVTACAGWFLSNDEAAYARACDKALAGLAEIVDNP